MRRALKLWVWRHRRVWALARRARVLGRLVLRRPHEPEFALFGRLADRTGLFLDVGANAGQSAISFRMFNRRAPILSVEPIRHLEPELRLVKRVLRGGFDYVMCAAGSHEAEATLYVPVYEGTALTSQASLQRERAEDCDWVRANFSPRSRPRLDVEALPIRVRRLDDLQLAPDFVKVDVEGVVREALAGLARTLERHQPLLLVETPDDLDEVLSLDALSGYRPFVYDAEAGALAAYDGQEATNLFLVPRGFALDGLTDAAR